MLVKGAFNCWNYCNTFINDFNRKKGFITKFWQQKYNRVVCR